MKTSNILVFLASLIFASCNTIDTAKMKMKVDKEGNLTSIYTKDNRTSWLLQSSVLYEIDGDEESLEKTLVALPRKDGGVLLTLVLHNNGGEALSIEPTFPSLRNVGLYSVPQKNIWCFFPSQGRMATNEATLECKETYSGLFPFQWMDVSVPSTGGLCVMTMDTLGTPKNYMMTRSNGKIRMAVTYRRRTLEPGETWTLPSAVIYPHEGDWHQAFYYYRDWVKTWQKPMTPRKQWFRDIYNFRQLFLHDIFGEEGAYNESTRKMDLVGKVNASVDAFGGVDYVHVFDWGKDPVSGRVGDYNPWKYYGESLRTELADQIRQLNAMGTRTGFYLEGYLIATTAEIGKQKGYDWSMRNSNGKFYTNMGTGNYYACPLVQEWRDYLTSAVRECASSFDLSGIYIDQIGFGYHYPCYNKAHNHDTTRSSISGELQIVGEAGLMQQVKNSISSNMVTYTEECPNDVATQYQDGSFSYGIAKARNNATNPANIVLPRFAFPDFKIFEILHCDAAMGNDQEGVKSIFFNGNGIWLEGPLNNTTWFPLEIRDMIKHCYTVLKRNADALCSDVPEPQVETLHEAVYANCFPVEGKKFWTLYNTSSNVVNAPVLRVPHVEGAIYRDEWNDCELKPQIEDGYAVITLSMDSKGVSAVSQIK